jgi:hypothetical protein
MAGLHVHLDLNVGPRGLRGLLAAAMLLAVAPDLASENVTLTTYYPAPSGVYTQMITTGNTFLARDSGNVGVGMAAPVYKLDVAGNVRVQSAACSLTPYSFGGFTPCPSGTYATYTQGLYAPTMLGSSAAAGSTTGGVMLCCKP